MAVSKAAFPSVGSVTSTHTVLSSATTFKISSVQFPQVCNYENINTRRSVVIRANFPGEHSIKRRDVLANLLGTGVALSFCSQALAANPGSLARQRKVEKPKSKKPTKKPEEVKTSVIESASPSPNPPLQVPNAYVEPKLPEPLSTPEVPSVSEVPSIPQPSIVQEVPNPAIEAPAVQAETPNFDDFNVGDYFKDLF